MITVIVPVYNTETYLDQCIQSILSQSYDDFELLLINDGSTDNSGKICDMYAASDPRIKVFHKENGGVSSARNIGLDNANGEWVSFCDSDDWIETNYLESLIVHSDADLIMSSFEFYGKKENWDNSISSNFYPKEEIKCFLKQYVETVALCAPYCKLFKKCLISGLRFNDHMSSKEDTVFVFEYLCKTNSIRTVENWGYKYRRGLGDSLSVRLLPINQCLYIINEYSKSFQYLEKAFNYQDRKSRVSSNSGMLNRSLSSIRESNCRLRDKYRDFMALMFDSNIREVLSYRDPGIKGMRRNSFDICVRLRLYPIAFLYVMLYRGRCIY